MHTHGPPAAAQTDIVYTRRLLVLALALVVREEERETRDGRKLCCPVCQLTTPIAGYGAHLTGYSAPSRTSTTSNVCVGSRSSASEKSSPAPFANWRQCADSVCTHDTHLARTEAAVPRLERDAAQAHASGERNFASVSFIFFTRTVEDQRVV